MTAKITVGLRLPRLALTLSGVGGQTVSQLGLPGPQGPPGAPGADGAPGPAGSPTEWRGTYNGAIQYEGGDAVEVGGVAYLATLPTLGVAPPAAPWVAIEFGPAGPPGPQGNPGPAGTQGPTGPAGVAGPAGPAGPQGAVGEAGPAGPEGPAGPQGPAGAQGLIGPAGPQGVQGPQGNTGSAGPEWAAVDRWAKLGISLSPSQPAGLTTYEAWLAAGGVGLFGWIQTPTTDVIYVSGSPITLALALPTGTVLLDAKVVQGSPIDLALGMLSGAASTTDPGSVDVTGSPIDMALGIPLGAVQFDARLVAGEVMSLALTTLTGTVTLEGGGTAAVTDDFNRANGGLGANWTTVTGLGAPLIASNQIPYLVAAGWQAAYYSGETFTANQYAAAKNESPASPGIGVMVRQSASDKSCYRLWRDAGGEDPENWDLFSLGRVAADGSVTWICDTVPYAYMRLEVNGSTVTVKGKATAGGTWSALSSVGGASLPWTDPSPLSSGSPGIALFYGVIDDFAAGDL
jgi:hypothetical protein